MNKGWELKKLGEVCVVERGSSPRPIDKFITDSQDGVNWVKIGDTKGVSKYIYTTKEKITREGAKKSRFVKEGDFILSNSMSFGNPYIMKTEGYIHDGWFVLRLPKSIDSNYFYYLLTSPSVQEQIHSLASGAIVKNISGDLIRQVKVAYPPLDEQHRIVAILDEAFTAIEQARENVQRNLQNTKELFQNELNAIFAKKGEGWKEKKFEEIIKTNVIGLTKSSKEQNADLKYIYIKMNNISRDNNFDMSSFVRVDASTQDVTKYNLLNGDFLFNTRNSIELVGKTCVYESPLEEPVLFNNNIMRIRFVASVDSKFINYLFSSLEMINKLSVLKSGTTNVAAIYYKDLRNLIIDVPPIEDQMKIVHQLDNLRAETKKLENFYQQKLDTLGELKQSVLQKAFNGELTAINELDYALERSM